MMKNVDELKIDNGKYTMLFNHATGKMWFNRFDEEWINDEETLHNHYPRKMLISMMYKSIQQAQAIEKLTKCVELASNCLYEKSILTELKIMARQTLKEIKGE